MPNADIKSDAKLRVGGVVLAGGLARRMDGRDKGLLVLADKPLVQWVLEQVSPQVDDVIINANRNFDAYSAFGPPVHADIRTGHLGPLAGLATGLSTLDHEAVFMCPCDSPFLPPTMVARLTEALLDTDSAIAVASDGSRMQPVFCLVRRSLSSSLERFLDSGERKIDRWFAAEKTVSVSFADTPDAFRNINTEEERISVEDMLAAS